MYSNWVYYLNPFTYTKMYVPFDGFIIMKLAETFESGRIWRVPTGLERGLVPEALDVEYNYSEGECDLVYGTSNILNPVINMVGIGGSNLGAEDRPSCRVGYFKTRPQTSS